MLGIRNEKMPADCSNCLLRRYPEYRCKADMNVTCSDEGRPENCPLVEINMNLSIDNENKLKDISEILFSRFNNPNISEREVIKRISDVLSPGFEVGDICRRKGGDQKYIVTRIHNNNFLFDAIALDGNQSGCITCNNSLLYEKVGHNTLFSDTFHSEVNRAAAKIASELQSKLATSQDTLKKWEADTNEELTDEEYLLQLKDVLMPDK